MSPRAMQCVLHVRQSQLLRPPSQLSGPMVLLAHCGGGMVGVAGAASVCCVAGAACAAGAGAGRTRAMAVDVEVAATSGLRAARVGQPIVHTIFAATTTTPRAPIPHTTPIGNPTRHTHREAQCATDAQINAPSSICVLA